MQGLSGVALGHTGRGFLGIPRIGRWRPAEDFSVCMRTQDRVAFRPPDDFSVRVHTQDRLVSIPEDSRLLDFQ